jgi:hypothetical protein
MANRAAAESFDEGQIKSVLQRVKSGLAKESICYK